MKKALFILLAISTFYGCSTLPENFSYRYTGENTGLGQLIDINGYYISPFGCDSSFHSVYMFYANGLFTIATTSEIPNEVIDCFREGGDSKLCKYPVWGIYELEGNLIRTQTLRTEGSGFVIFRDYRILPDESIVNISDYVELQYTNLAYISNYPSFTENPCKKKAVFYPLETKRDSTECPILKRLMKK